MSCQTCSRRPRTAHALSLPAVPPRARSIIAVAALLAAACGGTAGDESAGTVPPTSLAATTTAPATSTTTTRTDTTSATAASKSNIATSTTDTAPATTTSTSTTAPATSTTTASTTTKTVPPTAAEGLGDSFYPFLGNGGYDALHYEIDLDVDPAANTISALTSITAQATEDLEAFNLDLLGLEVHSVAVDGVQAEFRRSGHELTVQPASPLAANSQFEAAVSYSGSPEAIDDPGVPFAKMGWLHRDGVIYTLGEPSGSMTWFPSNNHPTDKATYEIQITVPEGVTAASNGLLVDETTSDGKTAYTWRMDDPMATYLAAVYVGDFERIDHGPLYDGGPIIRDYVPRDASPDVAQALSVTPDVIAFLEERLGPYPFDAYGTIVMPFPLGLALENQTLSIHGPATIGPGIIAHEAAHQWLGDSVSPDDWSEIWLNEGFPTYLHLMFEAEHFGADFNDTMTQVHAWLSSEGIGPPKGIEIQDLFGPTVYYRGAATLHALRLHTTDDTFYEILRTHSDRSAGGTTNTDEFLGIVDEFAGPEAVDLVESWLYDEALPPFVAGPADSTGGFK
ncbi:MAG: M1 family metallopeptidase [Acidimicrobiaceae bacterium]|nr:M1 family metallopeptidase [Acidimicrobiaceae bacterium]MYE98139.1 M1 family metallopeptidase [Acidimicrobiaceae bacterium]MYI53595.1 M1 family metallopeptidase [Acidimicrobiaceae bacterium]